MLDDSAVLAELAEEFTAKVRSGELPRVEDYAARAPRMAERIRQLFPTLMLLEGLAGGTPSATPAVLQPGAEFGPYRIEREIGRGGMGVVYEAIHRAMQRRVALKVLLAAGMEGGALERFLREAQTSAGLHHTNIVPVFDLGQVDGTPYFAMQLIDGRGLDRVLREWLSPPTEPAPAVNTDAPTLAPGIATVVTEPASPPTIVHSQAERRAFLKRVVEWGIQAADGLAHAHQRGVLHRDIKPSNLLLDAQGIVWITDFGLARRQHDIALTQSGALLGTPRYMSPEQAQAAKNLIDHRTDIYSLGATLYELATGRPAFTGSTAYEVLRKIIEDQPFAPRQFDPNISRDLETIVLKAMAKRPDDRYQSASDLADDLRRLQNIEPIRARRIGPVGRFTRWCRRDPIVAGAGTVAALLAVAVTIVSVVFGIYAKNSANTIRAEGKKKDMAYERTLDHLYRNKFQEARALMASHEPGRRWLAIDLLHDAERLRTRHRRIDMNTAGGNQGDIDAPIELPTHLDLRNLAVTALLTRDYRIIRDIAKEGYRRPFAISSSGIL